jgi:intracellular multiplication protein IcmJ
MAFLRISLGVSAFSDAGRVLPQDVHRPADDIRQAVFERDGHSCRYCGFTARKYQEVNYTGLRVPKGAARPAATAKLTADHYVTACTFCHQCFHLERVERMQSGALIWLPEIGQAALHHICRAIYIARISQGPMADAARDAMEALLARKEEAVGRLGTDSPRIIASVLQDFMETREYRARNDKLKGFRLLPLDRRIIREGELEFNQFPQKLAYWRSKDGPFGEHPPRAWVKTFYDMQGRLLTAEKTAV